MGTCTPSLGTAGGAVRGAGSAERQPRTGTVSTFTAQPRLLPEPEGQAGSVGQAVPFDGHQSTCWATVSRELGVERAKPQSCRKTNVFPTCVQTGICTKK